MIERFAGEAIEAALRDKLSGGGDLAAEYRLATMLLDRGEFREGWQHYEARKVAPNLPFPEWQGENLCGKRLVVWPEQGLGDKIMFSRYLPALRAEALTVLCEPALDRLFRANFDAEIVVASGCADFPDPDYWVFYGSLPFRLGANPPRPEPYLRATARASDARIGLCTRGSPQHPNDNRRSLPEDVSARLLDLPGAISLHVDDTGALDFLETAEIIAGLDLVISVDTAVSHLSAALGKPTWILLPYLGRDWRWGRAGEESTWYSAVRLFRQSANEPWAAVVERVISLARGR